MSLDPKLNQSPLLRYEKILRYSEMMSTWTSETTSSSINQGPAVSADAKTNIYRFARYSQSDGLIGSFVKYATIEKSVITGRKDTFFGRGDGLIFTVTSGSVLIHRLDPLKQTSRLYGVVQRPLNTEVHWQYRRDGLVKSIIKKGVNFMAFYENREDGKISCCGKLTDRGESIVDFSEVDVSFNGDFGKIERTLCVDDATDQIHITELSAHYQLSMWFPHLPKIHRSSIHRDRTSY